MMLSGLGNFLLSNLKSRWEEIVRDVENVLGARTGSRVVVYSTWMYAFPIVEVWGMETHGVATVLDLLERGLLEPVILHLEPDGENMLLALVGYRPSRIIFYDPVALEETTPIIFIPFNIYSIGMSLIGRSTPALTVIPIDFANLETSIEALGRFFPQGVEIANRFFEYNPTLHDLLRMLGTLYEKVDLNPIIFLAPYQNFLELDKDSKTCARILDKVTYPIFGELGIRPLLRRWVIRALALYGKKLLDMFKRGKIKIETDREDRPIRVTSTPSLSDMAFDVVDYIWKYLLEQEAKKEKGED